MHLQVIQNYAVKVGDEVLGVVKALDELSTVDDRVNYKAARNEDQSLHLRLPAIIKILRSAARTFLVGRLYREADDANTTYPALPAIDRAFVLKLVGLAEEIITEFKPVYHSEVLGEPTHSSL